MRELKIKTVDEGMNFSKLRSGDIVHIEHLGDDGSGFYLSYQSRNEKIELIAQSLSGDSIRGFMVAEGMLAGRSGSVLVYANQSGTVYVTNSRGHTERQKALERAGLWH